MKAHCIFCDRQLTEKEYPCCEECHKREANKVATEFELDCIDIERMIQWESPFNEG